MFINCLVGVLTITFSLFFFYQAFNPDNEYHFKNRMKASQRNWAEVFGDDSMFAVSPSSSYQKVTCTLYVVVVLLLPQLLS